MTKFGTILAKSNRSASRGEALQMISKLIHGQKSANEDAICPKGVDCVSVGEYCLKDSLDKKLVKSKIVCDKYSNGEGPLLGGSADFISKGPIFGETSDNLALPGSYLTNTDAVTTISRSEEVTDSMAPCTPSFSSRGPNIPITRNILKALYPGLVYDADKHDYVKFLCGAGYSDDKILQLITGNQKLKTVTNVGPSNSTYKAKLVAPKGLKVVVSPSILSFTSIGQKLSFSLKLEGKLDRLISSASSLWDDGTFQVRSPIIVYIAP
ncbi:subtilisin-like protease SBT3 [Ziziphus jujuba]|uniref:Subtilisin-like protease SBT3 n=1 Tax=Ziziphus jujuba TaxID=326968 RepID=A0A6P6G0R6_ZIZJJ|nr:subtilisin-like protease SBT3 [Ziziphus jujuba]